MMQKSWLHYKQQKVCSDTNFQSFSTGKWVKLLSKCIYWSDHWFWLKFSIIQSPCSHARVVCAEISEDQLLISQSSLPAIAQRTHLKWWSPEELCKIQLRCPMTCSARCLPPVPLYTRMASLSVRYPGYLLSLSSWAFSLLCSVASPKVIKGNFIASSF